MMQCDIACLSRLGSKVIVCVWRPAIQNSTIVRDTSERCLLRLHAYSSEMGRNVDVLWGVEDSTKQ